MRNKKEKLKIYFNNCKKRKIVVRLPLMIKYAMNDI